MSITLPSQLNYAEVLPSLGSGSSNIQHCLLPISGSTFDLTNAGTIVSFDLPSQNFMDGKTLFLRYKYKITSSGETEIRGSPFFSPLQCLNVLFGSQIVENQNDYNVINHMLTNVSLNIAEKVGASMSYGNRSDNGKVDTLSTLNGRHCEQSEEGYLLGQIECILSNSDKLIPLGLMPAVRVTFFLDSISSIFGPARAAIAPTEANNFTSSAAVVVLTGFQLSDMQLTFNTINFGAQVLETVREMGDTLYIKSSSWNNSMTSLPINTSGTNELVFNSRYASVKSLFLHTSSTNTNGKFDSFNPAKCGSLQFNIAGKYYPQRPLVDGSITPNLKQAAVGSIYDRTNSMSITDGEFLCTLGTPTSIFEPAKIYPSINTSITPFSNEVLLNG